MKTINDLRTVQIGIESALGSIEADMYNALQMLTQGDDRADIAILMRSALNTMSDVKGEKRRDFNH